MQFISTRNRKPVVNFRTAVFEGLSPDGGLYHPLEIKDLGNFYDTLSPDMSFVSIAAGMIKALFNDEIPRADADELARVSFPFSPELSKLYEGLYLLELYHGPSFAFKDFGASFLANTMSYFLKKEQRRSIILTATSGDTGSAVAKAFYDKANIDVVILYPSGRVSPLQEKQLTTLDKNIHALEVEGSFDDCQRMVKEAFVDAKLKDRFRLTSANSINLGRLIPQSFYYIWAYAHLLRHKGLPPCFCVPSGNFGNLTAGVYAWQWGLPVSRFIAATNINDVVPEYLKSSVYTPRSSCKTLSNAMDVGAPSNFERLTAVFENDADKMRSMIEGRIITDEETITAINDVSGDTGRTVDPHTAVGVLAAKRHIAQESPEYPVVVLGTAHPGKFIEVVEKASGITPELPESLRKVLDLEKKSVVVENTVESLKAFLEKTFQS